MSFKSIYYLGKLWKNPKKPYKDIQKYQLKKLKAVISHAYHRTPFYHHKFKKAGVHPDDISSLKDITKLPFTTKEELRETQLPVFSRSLNSRNFYTVTTSGTSGRKLKIIHSNDYKSFVNAIFYRTYLDWGMRPFKKLMYIRYNPLKSHFGEKLGIIRSSYVSTFLDVEKQFKLIEAYCPHILVGHPPDLVALAKLARKVNHCQTFDFIGSNSELLTQKEREFIEETFECPVYNEYSSLEVGFMARTCRKKRMHIVSDSTYLEFVKDGEPVAAEERGEVVATLLFENSTPFIRYRHRDIASFSDEQCDCGINFPLMNMLEGRKDDFLILPSGKEIPPTRIVPLFFDIDTITDFKVIQTSLDKVVVNVVPAGSFDNHEKENLAQLIEKELPEIDIHIKIVESIEKTPRGKKRAVVRFTDEIRHL